MTAPAAPLRETLLRQCLAADPGPWYPRDYAQANGLDRESLYSPLNDLRLANLVQLTEWVSGKGQGYLITPLGKEVLSDPLFLAQLRDGRPTAAVAAAEPSREEGESRFERGEAARRAFYFPSTGRVTPVLIGVNLVAFAVTFVVAARMGVPAMQFLRGGDVLAMHKMGAVGATDIARGEWWRLLSNCFLHFGLMHITLNMFSLALLRRVESLWGPSRFLMLYLICGICGSCAAVFFHPGDLGKTVYLAGASGALWGVMLSQATWLALHWSHLGPGEARNWLQQLFFTLLLNVGVSMLPGVSAAAHFGGGAAGIVAALFLQMHRFGPARRRAIAGIALALLPTLFMLGLATAMDYDPRLTGFVAQEYREQAAERVGTPVSAIQKLEPRAEALHLQDSQRRDEAELAAVQQGLSNVVKQAHEAEEWLRKSDPGRPARPIRDKALHLLDTLVAYAKALEQEAAGKVVSDINAQRAAWQEANVEWDKTAGR